MKPYGLHEALAELADALTTSDEQHAALLKPVIDSFDGDTVTPAPVLTAARLYAASGLRVLPLQPMLKEPHRGSHGCSEASADLGVVFDWWQRWPRSNVGIATGHLVDVIDFDGVPGQVAWRDEFGEGYGGLTVLGTVSTPRPGGLHVYVRATGEKNRIGMLPHVDYRGAGGYVVAPPSRTAVGSYRWLRTLLTDELT